MTATELIKERERLAKTQEEMAEFLNGTSVHTYRKWEQGVRKVPVWVPSLLIPKELEIGPLTFDELQHLDNQARERGISIPQLVGEYIREGLKKGISLVLLALVAFQAFAPDDHQIVRKFGRGRRRDDIAAVEEIDTDGGEG